MPDLKVTADELKVVQDILHTHLPGMEVWAFGSRVHGGNLKPFSDLDLALITESPLETWKVAELKDAFSESSLPFKVDLLDWSTTSESFRDIVRRGYLIVQAAR